MRHVCQRQTACRVPAAAVAVAQGVGCGPSARAHNSMITASGTWDSSREGGSGGERRLPPPPPPVLAAGLRSLGLASCSCSNICSFLQVQPAFFRPRACRRPARGGGGAPGAQEAGGPTGPGGGGQGQGRQRPKFPAYVYNVSQSLTREDIAAFFDGYGLPPEEIRCAAGPRRLAPAAWKCGRPWAGRTLLVGSWEAWRRRPLVHAAMWQRSSDFNIPWAWPRMQARVLVARLCGGALLAQLWDRGGAGARDEPPHGLPGEGRPACPPSRAPAASACPWCVFLQNLPLRHGVKSRSWAQAVTPGDPQPGMGCGLVCSLALAPLSSPPVLAPTACAGHAARAAAPRAAPRLFGLHLQPAGHEQPRLLRARGLAVLRQHLGWAWGAPGVLGCGLALRELAWRGRRGAGWPHGMQRGSGAVVRAEWWRGRGACLLAPPTLPAHPWRSSLPRLCGLKHPAEDVIRFFQGFDLHPKSVTFLRDQEVRRAPDGAPASLDGGPGEHWASRTVPSLCPCFCDSPARLLRWQCAPSKRRLRLTPLSRHPPPPLHTHPALCCTQASQNRSRAKLAELVTEKAVVRFTSPLEAHRAVRRGVAAAAQQNCNAAAAACPQGAPGCKLQLYRRPSLPAAPTSCAGAQQAGRLLRQQPCEAAAAAVMPAAPLAASDATTACKFLVVASCKLIFDGLGD